MVLKFNAHLVKCRLKYGLCNPPLVWLPALAIFHTFFSIVLMTFFLFFSCDVFVPHRLLGGMVFFSLS